MKKALLPRLAQLGIALSAALTPLAHAGLVSYTTSAYHSAGGYSSSGSSQKLSYQRFDADLGVLREVRLSYDYSMHQTFIYSNVGDADAEMNVGHGGGISVYAPVYWGKYTDQSVRLDVPAHTREASFEYDWREQFTTTLTQDLDRFIGDTPATMNVYLELHTRTHLSQYLGFGSLSNSQLTVRFDYVYDTPPPPSQRLPEPATPALAGLALAAALWQRRRRTATHRG